MQIYALLIDYFSIILLIIIIISFLVYQMPNDSFAEDAFKNKDLKTDIVTLVLQRAVKL